MESEHKECIPLLLQPHLWLLLILEIVIAAVSLLLNCAIGVSSYYTLAIPFFQRRTFAIIAFNYAFLASILLAKKCFFLFSAHYPCISVVSTVSCKLQEFPSVFSCIYAAILPLVLALQCIMREANQRKEKQVDWISGTNWTSACSIHQISLLIFCIGLSLMFTAFDHDFSRELLQNCSIVIAIQQKHFAFWLITLLVSLHSLTALFWQLICINNTRKADSQDIWKHSFRLIIILECLLWLLTLLCTGVLIVNQYISERECKKCSILAIEICFTSVPLLISVLHPVLTAWLSIHVRKKCAELFPALNKFVDAQELDTPPLPPRPSLPNSTVRILITKSDTPSTATMTQTFRIPNLNPLDYSIWAILEAKFNCHRYASLVQLRKALQQPWDEIDVELLASVAENWRKRMRACVKANGGYFKF